MKKAYWLLAFVIFSMMCLQIGTILTAANTVPGTRISLTSQPTSAGCHTNNTDTADIETTNGGTAGLPDGGDTIVYTFSRSVLATSVLSSWNGCATAVVVRFTNSSNDDPFALYTPGGTLLPMGSTTTGGNFTSSGADINASMKLSSTGSDVIVTLGTLASGSVSTAPNGHTSAMEWTPSAGMKYANGTNVSTTTVVETGTKDRAF